MAPSLLISSLFFAVAARGLIHHGPRATAVAAIPLDAQSPKPTLPPSLHQFLKRQDQGFLIAPDNTCGYVSGQSAAAYTCVGATNTCVLISVSAGGNNAKAAGCCDVNDCGIRVDCLDLEDVSSLSLCDRSCATDTFTEKCTESQAPFCNTVVFRGGYTDYFCGPSRISTAQSADTTFSGQTGRTFEAFTLDASVSEQLPRTTRSRPAPTPGDSESTGPGFTSPPGPANSGGAAGGQTGDSGSSPPIGAIVGGVVGGLAVIGLVVLGAFYIMRQKKAQAGAPAESPPGPETQQQNFPPPGQPDVSPYVAPSTEPRPGHQSMVSNFTAVQPYPSPQSQYQQPYSPDQYQNQNQNQMNNYPPDRHPSTSPGPGQGYPSPQQTYGTPSPQQAYGTPSPQLGYGVPPPQAYGAPPADVYEAGGQPVVNAPAELPVSPRAQLHEMGQ